VTFLAVTSVVALVFALVYNVFIDGGHGASVYFYANPYAIFLFIVLGGVGFLVSPFIPSALMCLGIVLRRKLFPRTRGELSGG